MNREYWLCRATDFPSSIAQFGTHALALAYAHAMPGNPYHGHPKILEWALAGMEYWTRIQHRDGSFDEFYPNERGWAGPTGFLLYVMCDTYRLLEPHLPADLRERVLQAAHRAALFLARTDEAGVLANHHAMAVLPLVEAHALLGDPKLETAFKQKLDIFFHYCRDEGWAGYDGADPGYCRPPSVSSPRRAGIMRTSAFAAFVGGFSSYRLSQRPLRRDDGQPPDPAFHPHGYELLAGEIPLAAAVADRMLRGLRDGAVPPEIQGGAISCTDP